MLREGLADSATSLDNNKVVQSGGLNFVCGNVIVEGTNEGEGREGALPVIVDYDWVSHDVEEYAMCFRTKTQLEDWAKRNCILKSIEFDPLFKLVACERNEQVFHGKWSD